MDDESILALYFSRDERAVRESDSAYGGRLRALSRRITGSAEDAEECVNDTWLKAWESIPPTHPAHLFAYFATICRHLAFDVLDRAGAQKRSAVVVELTAELEQCVPDPRQDASERELPRLLEAFLRAQSEENRRLFLRRYWYGDSMPELANAFGMSENAVKLRLLRTREKLRDYLEREGITV